MIRLMITDTSNNIVDLRMESPLLKSKCAIFLPSFFSYFFSSLGVQGGKLTGGNCAILDSGVTVKKRDSKDWVGD